MNIVLSLTACAAVVLTVVTSRSERLISVSVFWMLLILSVNFLEPNRDGWKYILIFLLCYFVCRQDFLTMHFGLWWLAAEASVLLSSLFFPPVSLANRLLALWPALAALFFWRTGKMGSADIWALAAAGWILGLERMNLCLFLSCFLALFWSFLHRQNRKIPFISFLSAAFCLCLLRGYSMLSLYTPFVFFGN